jgi:hypothetical protein
MAESRRNRPNILGYLALLNALRGGAQIKGHGWYDLNMDPGSPFLKALRARRSHRRLVREGCE